LDNIADESARTFATRSDSANERYAMRARGERSLHCRVLTERRYLSQAQPRGLLRALAAAGHHVTLCDPQDALLDLSESHWLDVDLVVARGRSTDLLARLSAAEAAGVPTLNSRSAIESVLDKAHMTARLHAAGIATPRTWIGSIEQVRRAIPRCAFPLILKPVFGDNCRGIVIVETPAALAAVTWSEPCVIVQCLLPSDGFDIKLYAMGGRVWAMRKQSALHGATGAVAPSPLPLAAAWHALALDCGALFGLQLFGVDCIEVDGALQVIEVNDFPNYSGVPDADFLLARHVAQYALARRHS
jgi:ribosomal protein S6--L-glutamate ligase